MIYDIGGWFYEPDSNMVYVINRSSEQGSYLAKSIGDKSGPEFYLSAVGIESLIIDKILYYIPHTKDLEKFTKKIFEINLKHDFSE